MGDAIALDDFVFAPAPPASPSSSSQIERVTARRARFSISWIQWVDDGRIHVVHPGWRSLDVAALLRRLIACTIHSSAIIAILSRNVSSPQNSGPTPTNDIAFRPIADAGVADLLPLLNDPRIARHMPLATRFTEQSAIEWVKGKQAQWEANGYGPWSFWLNACNCRPVASAFGAWRGWASSQRGRSSNGALSFSAFD